MAFIEIKLYNREFKNFYNDPLPITSGNTQVKLCRIITSNADFLMFKVCVIVIGHRLTNLPDYQNVRIRYLLEIFNDKYLGTEENNIN